MAKLNFLYSKMHFKGICKTLISTFNSSGFVKPVETERVTDRLYELLCNQKPLHYSKTCQKDVKNLGGWLLFEAFDCNWMITHPCIIIKG